MPESSRPSPTEGAADRDAPLPQAQSHAQLRVALMARVQVRTADSVSRTALYKEILGPVESQPGRWWPSCRARSPLSAKTCNRFPSSTRRRSKSLRSANEELHSVNEEMQSTNEELETSKEELQSLNEELHTVNIRLTEKIDGARSQQQ